MCWGETQQCLHRKFCGGLIVRRLCTSYTPVYMRVAMMQNSQTRQGDGVYIYMYPNQAWETCKGPIPNNGKLCPCHSTTVSVKSWLLQQIKRHTDQFGRRSHTCPLLPMLVLNPGLPSASTKLITGSEAHAKACFLRLHGQLLVVHTGVYSTFIIASGRESSGSIFGNWNSSHVYQSRKQQAGSTDHVNLTFPSVCKTAVMTLHSLLYSSTSSYFVC